MRTVIQTSTVKSRNTEGIIHPSDPAGQESKLKEREIGSGLIPKKEETAATGEHPDRMILRIFRYHY